MENLVKKNQCCYAGMQFYHEMPSRQAARRHEKAPGITAEGLSYLLK